MEGTPLAADFEKQDPIVSYRRIAPDSIANLCGLLLIQSREHMHSNPYITFLHVEHFQGSLIVPAGIEPKSDFTGHVVLDRHVERYATGCWRLTNLAGQRGIRYHRPRRQDAVHHVEQREQSVIPLQFLMNPASVLHKRCVRECNCNVRDFHVCT